MLSPNKHRFNTVGQIIINRLVLSIKNINLNYDASGDNWDRIACYYCKSITIKYLILLFNRWCE